MFSIAHCAAYQLAYPLLMGFPLVVPARLAALPQLLPLFFPTNILTFCAIVGATWIFCYSSLSRERELKASR